MPEYLYRPLADNLEAIQAEELLAQAAIAKIPRLEASAIRDLERTLERAARLPAERPAPAEAVEHDPQKAREWLEAHGVVFGKRET